MALYHYTCREHGADGISRLGLVRPNRHPLLGASLVWLTDLPTPDRRALGLTMGWITCDRTQVRIEVDPTRTPVLRWGLWAHQHKVSRLLRDLLEEGASPGHWWVAEAPITVVGRRETRKTPAGRRKEGVA
ncbi:MAG: hypothetical protein ACRDQG_12130 [Pseudonocardiaceae bacterium]